MSSPCRAASLSSSSMRGQATTGGPIHSHAGRTRTSPSAAAARRARSPVRSRIPCSSAARLPTAIRSARSPAPSRADAVPRGRCSGLCNRIYCPLPVASDLRMPVLAKTVVLLVLSNIFMTFAWYAHLRHLSNKPWIVAALVSWGIALFEYLLQVPANRIGHARFELGQLKILQEVITLSVFVPFAALYMKEPVRLNYLWAALCMCGAVFFAFRGGR